MNDETIDLSFELIPNVGWEDVRLGDSESDVRASLKDNAREFDESLDTYRWELTGPWCTLSFANEPDKRLVQISSSSEAAHVYGIALVGMRLDEALVALEIKRFDDTVWSVGEVESDFDSGKPLMDSDQRKSRPGVPLLHHGTLWIKSLGLGLSLYAAEIDSIAIRDAKYVPKIGYGPLDEQTLDAASDPQTSEQLLRLNRRFAEPMPGLSLPFRAILGLSTVVTGAVLAWVIYTMYNDYQSWINATPVVGKVVETRPEGPFPDELIVEYSTPDSQLSRVTVRTQYSTAREIGEEVELVYRDSDPSVAMTRLQSRDDFSSLSMNWLMYTVPLFSLELLWLFPNLSYRRKH